MPSPRRFTPVAGIEMMNGILPTTVGIAVCDGFRVPEAIAVFGAFFVATVARLLLGHDRIAQHADRRNLDLDRIAHLDRAYTGRRPGHDDVAGKQRQAAA